MPGGYDKHPRFVPVRADPQGGITWTSDPVAVLVTLRVTRPTMDRPAHAWAVAWARNAVFCFWEERLTEGTRAQSGWLPVGDVQRATPRRDGSAAAAG